MARVVRSILRAICEFGKPDGAVYDARRTLTRQLTTHKG